MTKKLLMMISVLMLIIALASCSDDDDNGNDPDDPDVASCEGCHTNYDHLKLVHSPDTTAPAGGCGGTAPHYEPYDRVYLGGNGFATFQASSHYDIGCEGCHNGVGDTDDKKIAHSGDFVKHPSTIADEKCATCHSSEVSDAHNSIHQQGWGQKRKVTLRYGLSGPQDFAMLPANVQEGYNANCATCHASTCGDCHVIRPTAGGGGLMKGHDFFKPDMLNNCVACHSSRGGHAYFGEAPGSSPDVHLSKAGYDCMDCHSNTDVHGDGNIYEQRYAVAGLPQCTDCHTVGSENLYHTMHGDDLNCYTCHSQDYNSCGSCHVHGQGVRISSYQDFKIAMNPIPELKDFKMALVRRTPAAPDQWEQYGLNEYPEFAAEPTWNYTTPHNINRWTSRTEVEAGGQCFENCHILEDGTNKKLYLFEEDLYEWEKAATTKITVNGNLPEGWE